MKKKSLNEEKQESTSFPNPKQLRDVKKLIERVRQNSKTIDLKAH